LSGGIGQADRRSAKHRGFSWADVIGPARHRVVVATVCLWMGQRRSGHIRDVHRVFGSIGPSDRAAFVDLMILQVLLAGPHSVGGTRLGDTTAGAPAPLAWVLVVLG